MRARPAKAGVDWRAFAELTRLPGVVTSAGNVLAGVVAATGLVAPPPTAAFAILASALLYAGGVALNDWFDRALDARERPTRPIPSGRVHARTALNLAALLVLAGVGVAALAGPLALLVAAGIGTLVVTYNAVAKASAVVGPLNMGLLRGLNFLLGAAIVPDALATLAPIALVYAAFVAGITLVARGEVAGGSRREAAGALALAVLAFASLAALLAGAPLRDHALPFGLAWIAASGSAFALAAWRPAPDRAVAAVKRGVFALPLLDATIAAAAAGWPAGVVVACLLAPAILIGRAISVT